MYRTGDQVRLLDNGEIAFLGRLDRQVKIRGFRIEPAEIVAALDRAGGVAASAVVARGGPDGEPELVAYVVPAEGASPTTAELRHVPRRRLPDYMVPARSSGSTPCRVTLNGKLDEGALPGAVPGEPPARAGRPRRRTQRAARSKTRSARWCGRCWSCPPSTSGRTSSCSAATRCSRCSWCSRIQQVFGVKLPLRQLFDEPTVAGIAAAVARRMPADRAEARA